MKNMPDKISQAPLRENFFNGFHRTPVRTGLGREARKVFWMALEKFPALLATMSFMMRMMLIPRRFNRFEDLYQKAWNRLKAPLYNNAENNYFRFDGNPYRIVMIGDETRPSITVRNGAEITGSVRTEGGCLVRLGVGLNERIDPALMDCECGITATLKYGGQTLTNSFSFPVHGENNLFSHLLGESWIDWHMQLPFHGPGEAELVLRADFFKEKKRYDRIRRDAVTWSAPQIVVKDRKRACHSIICISVESLSDVFYLQKKFNMGLDIPSIQRLISEAVLYESAYAQGDATLPVAGGFLTGLLPLQHGITDYSIKPWDNRVKNLSPEIRTIAEILKEKGFYNQASVFQPRFSPMYGWYRGFDSYKYSGYTMDAPSCPSKFAINFLEGAKRYDTFLFMHWDGLHDNYWMSEPCSRIVLTGNYSQDRPMSVNSLYAERLHYLDLELGMLIDYLKSSGLWDETLLIVTADHGFAGDKWVKGQEFSLYEERIKVPYVIKWPRGHGPQGVAVKEPTGATLGIFSAIHSALDMPLPDYCPGLPQYDSRLKGMVASETVGHPRDDDYACVLISDKFKYAFRCKIDMDKYEMREFLYDRLSQIRDGDFDDAEDISRDRKAETERFRKIALDLVKTNLGFLKKHKPIGMKGVPC